MQNRKLVMMAPGVIAALLLVNSCKDEQAGTSLQQYKEIKINEPVQLNVVGHWLGEGKKEQMVLELINEFEFTNPDIKVNMEWPDNLYKLRTKDNQEAQFNAAQMSSDKPDWDVIRINNEVVAIDIVFGPGDADWARKYLVDFSQEADFVKYTKPELITEEAKEAYHGIAPGPFLDGNYWLMWCNTEIAKKVGIEVKQYDMTIEDFLSYLKAVSDYNSAHSDSIIGLYESYDCNTSPGIAQMLFFSEIGDYGQIIDNRFSERKVQAWEKVLNDLERIASYKPFPGNWQNLIWSQTSGYPIESKCLFFLNATWMYNIWLEMDSSALDHMMPMEIPVYRQSPMCLGGYNVTWAVPKNSPHREQAIRFLLFINRPDVAEKWARYTKSPTGITGNLANVNFGFDKFESFQFTLDRKYGKNKTTLLLNSKLIFGEQNQSVDNCTMRVLMGEITASQAMQEIRRGLRR